MTTLTCHRCGCTLTPGNGDFYVVRIESVADPAPRPISAEDLQRDWRAEIQILIRQIDKSSAQELTDQVYRRLFIHLCRPCHDHWIEDPAGSP